MGQLMHRNILENMSNIVERSSIALKVRNLYKVRSFSSRYRKKKQFFDVLSYQKLHKLQKYQDRKLNKMKILQDEVLKKEEVVTKHLEEDHKKDSRKNEDNYCEDEEDICSNSELSEDESEDEEIEEHEVLENEEVVAEYFEEDPGKYNRKDEDDYCEDEEDLGSNSELS